MKKARLLTAALLAALFFYNNLSAQIDIAWGKEFPMPKVFSSIALNGANKNYIVAKHVGHRASDMVFYRFDKNTLGFQGQFDPIQKNTEVKAKDYYKTVSIKNKIIMLYDVYNKTSDKYTLYAVHLGDDAKPTGGFSKVIEMDAKSRRNSGDYMVVLSRDSNTIGVIASPPYEKKGNEKLIVSTFDVNLKNLTSCQVNLHYKDQPYIPGTYVLTNDGDLIMQATVQLDKKSVPKGEPTSFPAIFKINTKDGTLDEYQIKIPDMNIQDADISVDDQNRIICAGFYGNPKKGNKQDIDGIYYIRINKANKQIEKTSMKEMPADLIKDLIGERRSKKGQGLSNAFKINHFIPRKDGGTTILGQQYYVTSVTYCDNKGNCRTTYYDNYDGILAINVDKNGDISWVKLIPIKQVLAQPDTYGLGSYVAAFTNDKIFLVYNDHEENRVKNVTTFKEAKTMSSAKKMVTVLAEIDNSGNFTIRRAFDAAQGKVKYFLSTNGVQKLRNNSFACILTSVPSVCNATCSAYSCGLIKSKRVAKVATFTFK